MAKLLTYEQKDTWMDRLCGVTKLIYFLAWSITSMLTYDTRVLAVMLVLSLILFKISKTEWKQVGSIFKFIMFFLVINVLAIFIFAPDQGTKIYGTKHVLWQLSAHYPITAEQLFYELNIILKGIFVNDWRFTMGTNQYLAIFKLEEFFPPDFIVEYTGQIRAWFYVLHVIATAVFGLNAFKDVLVTGVILGTDGRKMSKNYNNFVCRLT